MIKKQCFVSGLIAFSLAVATLTFQNCANTALEKEIESLSTFANLQTKICLNGSLSDYTVDATYVTNMSYVLSQSVIAPDSDSDGLSDEDEIRYGFSPVNRRSTSSVLDSTCLNLSGRSNCQHLVPACTGVPNKLGLSDCDIKLLNLDMLYGHPNHGLDSDKDGIPDVLEMVRGLLPNVRDDNDDPDHDLRLNSREVLESTDALHADRAVDSYAVMRTTVSQVNNSGNCAGGEEWLLESVRIPLVPVKQYFDPAENTLGTSGLTFSHAEDENVIVSFVKLKPRLGVVGKNSLIYFLKLNVTTKKVNFEAKLNSAPDNQYVKAGEVLP